MVLYGVPDTLSFFSNINSRQESMWAGNHCHFPHPGGMRLVWPVLHLITKPPGVPWPSQHIAELRHCEKNNHLLVNKFPMNFDRDSGQCQVRCRFMCCTLIEKKISEE
ncbi:hypothetical protein GOODEAATRI_019301 [Goodea atripinnis]|uniref:Uncharacterized protein n=1 Tax=Goodea atripinnis TaxID=208336 RepID=A0ABV0PZC6_9TELE